MTHPARIVVIYAHSASQRSRVNVRLAEAARKVRGVEVRDLYEIYPDFFIDVVREQAILTAADIIVFLHPIQWYGMPSLMKEWVDAVLTSGWAYGQDGTALQGKGYWMVATTGSLADAYQPGAAHGHAFGDFLIPFQQTAALCGMRWLAPMVLHGAHAVSDAEVDAHVAAFSEHLQELAASDAD
jgi:glutathione-regulated potassium-efflux system ancillary protein KefF